jgi:hypothetical protein
MATSPVEICNSALIKVGASRITSLSDGTKSALICNEQYPKLRREVLRQHPWNFAIRRKALAASVVEPEFDFSQAFVIPSDVLRILSTDLPKHLDWAVEQNSSGQRVLLTDSDTCKIRYIKDVSDTTIYSPDFEEALALRIAMDLAYSLAQSTSLTRELQRQFKEMLATARSIDAQEGSMEEFDDGEWIETRY